MKIKNGEINLFITYLDSHTLISTESRMRTRLKKMLLEKLQLFDIDRQELVSEFSRKDEEGKPISITNKEGQSVGDIEDMAAFNAEYNKLRFEDIYIEETLSNKQMLETCRNIVLNDSTGYKGNLADEWDYWCEMFESVNYEDSDSIQFDDLRSVN